jgi:DivIVA domain-containing protein
MKGGFPRKAFRGIATNMPFSPDEIEIKEFVPTLRGYGREEVRAYLRSVSEDVRRLEDQLEAAKSSAPGLQAKHVQVAPVLELQDHPSTELSPPISESLTTTFAAAGLAAADLRLVSDLREALSELTQAIAQLNTQGFPAQMAAAPETTPAPVGLQPIPQLSPISVPAKLEPPFVHVKPPQVANSGLGKRDQAQWNGIDRRGPERPWNSAVVNRSADTIAQETSLGNSQQISANHLGAGSFAFSAYDPVSTGENTAALSIDRERRNQSLIGSFLKRALGQNQTPDRNVANRGVGQTTVTRPDPGQILKSPDSGQVLKSPDSGQIVKSLADEVDNVVAFKRAAS